MKRQTNIPWLIAGIIALLTAIVHTIGGQLDLINPLIQSSVNNQVELELIAVWHMVTAFLFVSAFIFLRAARQVKWQQQLPAFLGILYLLFSISFVVVSTVYGRFAPQWILLLPVGILALWGRPKPVTIAS